MKSTMEFSIIDPANVPVYTASFTSGFTTLVETIGVRLIIQEAIRHQFAAASVALSLRPILTWGQSHPGVSSPLFQETMRWLEDVVKVCDNNPSARFDYRR